MKIEELDKNLLVEKTFDRDDVVFMDVRKAPFKLYGLYKPEEGEEFIRIPSDLARETNEGVAFLAYHTAGGRVRFKTNSPFIAIRAKMKEITRFPHMPMTGVSGFDLYQHTSDGRDTFFNMFTPPVDMTDGYQQISPAINDGEMHTYTIHFPLYNVVSSLEIGLQAGAELEAGDDYLPIAPVVYYGSSITQGGCASRPGNAYQNIISARNNIDHINLGFSGSARGEECMAKYIASLDMSCFVMDYDHNAPNVAHLEATHEKFFRIIREAHPDLPVIFVTKPDARVNEDAIARRNVVYTTYHNAYAAGDRNVSFVDGYSFFEPEYHDICTVDGCHPNDAGFVGMARVLGREITRAMNHRLW